MNSISKFFSTIFLLAPISLSFQLSTALADTTDKKELIKTSTLSQEPITIDLKRTGSQLLSEFEDSLSNGIGIGFSGGGSRAVALTTGQLFALKEIGLEDKIKRLSLVSGGAWAGALFYMLPNKTAQEQSLITTIDDLQELCWKSHDNSEKSDCLHPVNYTNPKSLLSIPQRLSLPGSIGAMLFPMLPGYNGWRAYLSKNILEPYGIDSSRSIDSTRFPLLGNKELIINAQLIPEVDMDKKDEDREKIPFEITPNRMGISKNNLPHNSYYIHPYAFNRFADRDSLFCLDNTNTCRINLYGGAEFTLSDMMAVTGSNYISTWPFSYFPPTFDYPKIDFSTKPPLVTNSRIVLTDSGNEDFVGLMPLLARKQSKIILFSNSGKRLHTNGSVIGMEKVLPSYFGIIPDEGAEKSSYETAEELNIPKDCQHNSRRNHVFLTEEYNKLATGLLTAKKTGKPIVFLQKNLQVLANPCYGITEGKVDILWVYNELPEGWMDKLNPELKERLNGNKEFDAFPLYKSMDLYLTEAQTNLLSRLAAWSLLNSKSLIDDFTQDPVK